VVKDPKEKICNELTPKQQAFVEEYIVDLNGTQSAIRAGYSAKTANRIASQNLSFKEPLSKLNNTGVGGLKLMLTLYLSK
jgi:hypothetical protein